MGGNHLVVVIDMDAVCAVMNVHHLFEITKRDRIIAFLEYDMVVLIDPWVQIKICTKADTDSLIRLNSSFLAPSGALSA